MGTMDNKTKMIQIVLVAIIIFIQLLFWSIPETDEYDFLVDVNNNSTQNLTNDIIFEIFNEEENWITSISSQPAGLSPCVMIEKVGERENFAYLGVNDTGNLIIAGCWNIKTYVRYPPLHPECLLFLNETREEQKEEVGEIVYNISAILDVNIDNEIEVYYGGFNIALHGIMCYFSYFLIYILLLISIMNFLNNDKLPPAYYYAYILGFSITYFSAVYGFTNLYVYFNAGNYHNIYVFFYPFIIGLGILLISEIKRKNKGKQPAEDTEPQQIDDLSEEPIKQPSEEEKLE